jgi:hypothetical protein
MAGACHVNLRSGFIQFSSGLIYRKQWVQLLYCRINLYGRERTPVSRRTRSLSSSDHQ